MATVKCCNCPKEIDAPKTGYYNTPIGAYCCDCYDKVGKRKVAAYFKKQPILTINSIKI